MSQRAVEIVAALGDMPGAKLDRIGSVATAALDAGADALLFAFHMPEEGRGLPDNKAGSFQTHSADSPLGLLGDMVGRGAKIYCEISSVPALEAAASAGVHGYQVASPDLGNMPLLVALRQMARPVLLAVAGATAPEIVRAVTALAGSGCPLPVLVHGLPDTHTPTDDACLRRLVWLQQVFGAEYLLGYRNASDADDPFAASLPLLALSMGATVLVKDITSAAPGPSTGRSALDLSAFATFVWAAKRASKALGDAPQHFTPSESAYRRRTRKRWTTTRPLSAGQVLTPRDLRWRLIDDGPEPVEQEKLLGRPVLKDCPEGHALKRSDLPQTVWALVFARMRSTRLPGKALADVCGMPALLHLFERLKQARSVDRIVLCTTRESHDDPLIQLAHRAGIPWFRGPTEDVLARTMGALDGQAVDVIVRITGDDILIDPDYLDRAVLHHLEVNAEYSDSKALPSGTEVEVIDVALLRKIWGSAKDSSGSEYLTYYIVDHRDHFRTSKVPVDERHARPWRFTLDTAEDYEAIRALLEGMRARGKVLSYRLDDIVDFVTAHPEILEKNALVRQRQAPLEVCTDLEWTRVT